MKDIYVKMNGDKFQLILILIFIIQYKLCKSEINIK